MGAKETFILRSEWQEDLDLLSMEERGQLLTLLFEYANDYPSDLPAYDKGIQIVFKSWRRFIALNNEKWQATKGERSRAGKASAEAKRKRKAIKQNQENCNSVQQDAETCKEVDETYQETCQQTATNLTSVEFVEQNQQTATNSTVSVSVSDSVSDSVSVSDSDIDNEKKNKQKESAAAQEALAEIIAHYELETGSAVAPIMATAFQQYLHDMELSLLTEAVDEAKRRNALRWPYIKAILNSWHDAGLHTIEELEEYKLRGAYHGNTATDRERTAEHTQQPPGIIVLG